MDPHVSPRTARPSRGTTLLEAMIALAILAVGIAGTIQLQVLGVTSNAGASYQTQAYELARELTQALSQLPPDDPLLAYHYLADEPPAEFGHLLVDGAVDTSAPMTVYDDAMPLAGVTSDAALMRVGGGDPLDPGKPAFQRRWQVWQKPNAAAAGGSGGGLNVVAVSVIYREPRLPGLREVVLLTQVSNTGIAASFVAAYR